MTNPDVVIPLIEKYPIFSTSITPHKNIKKYINSLSSYEEVFRYYKLRFDELYKGNYILKTDCYNEANNRPIIDQKSQEKATLVEIDPNTIELALQKNPNLNIIQGDIRNFELNAKFDQIFDFSTIDHVEEKDVPQVLDNYKKHLKDGGEILIIFWSGDPDHRGIPNQYFFRRDFVRDEFQKRFKLLEEKELFMDGDFVLIEFYGVGIS